MRVLVDTCVIIDALQSRVPFAEAAQKIFIHSANKHFEGYITAAFCALRRSQMRFETAALRSITAAHF